MNRNLLAFINLVRRAADENGVHWDLSPQEDGAIPKDKRWNLNAICGLPSPPCYRLSTVGPDQSAKLILKDFHERGICDSIAVTRLHTEWEELIKATILHELLIKANKPGHALNNVGRVLRILATCAMTQTPGEINGESVKRAYNVALNIGKSGATAINLSMVVRMLFDNLQLSKNSPLSHFCAPYDDPSQKIANSTAEDLKYFNNHYRSRNPSRKDLIERKTHEKLPHGEAFRELVSILFTKRPKTVSDAIRFRALSIEIATGLRVGELTTIPFNWKQVRHFTDAKGRSAAEHGGIAEAIAVKYFSEKQANEGLPSKRALYEAIQYVPEILVPLVSNSIKEVIGLTEGMRERLKRQRESGRAFPEFSPEACIPIWDAYSRLTGATQLSSIPIEDELTAEYREAFSKAILKTIRDSQVSYLKQYGLHPNISKYFSKTPIKLRHWDGEEAIVRQRNIGDLWVRVDELESYVTALPTKASNTEHFLLENGVALHAHDLMFLVPNRAIVEQRNNGVLDLDRYFSIGRLIPADLQNFVSPGRKSIFSKYSDLDAADSLGLNIHSLRHLKTSELFRQGVPEEVITKHFNRRSIKQSHVYSHPTLSEDLEAMSLPSSDVEMSKSSMSVLRMISAGAITGPIVDEFRKIQDSRGDEAAFSYLSAEADGLHATPYGFCVNSFVVDPCPKHLECYNGCRHLARTSDSTESENLISLRGRMASIIESINSTPEASRTGGWRNQLEHATTRLENINRALSTSPGDLPFPGGKDSYAGAGEGKFQTPLDVKAKVWKPDA